MGYPLVMGEVSTLSAAVRDNLSLARFGDGELKLCLGRAAKSQEWAPDLQAILRQILLSKPGGPCLPCIPDIVIPGPKAKFWAEFKGPTYTRFYNPLRVYGSSFITRPDSAPQINRPEYWEQVRKLWAGRDIVLVRGSGKSLTPERMPGAASVKEILCPVQHAWTAQRQLFANLRKEKRRVFLCCGATATALAWMLSWEGVHALDLGHVGMMMRKIGPDGIIPPEAIASKE